VRYQWPIGGGPASPASVNQSLLQIYTLAAVACGPAPGTGDSSFLNASSAVGSLSTNISVVGQGTLVIDFGVESAAWVEFDSPDLSPADAGALVVGISEYNVVDYVGGFKQGKATAYPGGTFRLETNGELYEGVRYAFLTVPPAHPVKPFTITGLRLVVQAKAVNYTGSFSSPGDPVLEQVWYTAAYTVRAALQADYIGSVLVDRGDRFSWAGDAHPSQATAMAAFSAYPQVLENIVRGKDDDQGIATYGLYIVLSISEYFLATGDAASVVALTPIVASNLEAASALWPNPQGLRFVGWDDRLGSGFANNTTPETQAVYRLLAIRAWTEAAHFLNATGNATLAARYAAMAANRTQEIRAMGGTPWYGSFGLHAGADAVNAGFLTPDEQAGIAAGAIGDIVKLPSQSNFNQYFILQALSGLGQLDRGAESIRAVWGPILSVSHVECWARTDCLRASADCASDWD
jgi:alpha-L-rhamnosidase